LPKVKLIIKGSTETIAKKVTNIDLEGKPTLKDLILAFSMQIQEGFLETIYNQETNKIHDSVLIFINDKAISPLVALDALLEEGDTISIVYEIAGG
jgi:molybdopterin converting factor small subunit